jgi:hypothetical protein
MLLLEEGDVLEFGGGRFFLTATTSPSISSASPSRTWPPVEHQT